MNRIAHNSLASLPWSTVDWALGDVEIGRHLGCSHTTVGKYRRLQGKHNPRPLVAWHAVTDWANRPNADIARELGVTKKQVCVYRNRQGLPAGPRSPGTGLHRKNAPRKPPPLTLRECRKRLEAVWVLLWPADPANTQQRDEVAAIKQRSCCAQLP